MLGALKSVDQQELAGYHLLSSIEKHRGLVTLDVRCSEICCSAKHVLKIGADFIFLPLFFFRLLWTSAGVCAGESHE